MLFEIFWMLLTLFGPPEQTDSAASTIRDYGPSNDNSTSAAVYGRGLNHNETLVAEPGSSELGS